MTSAVNNQLVPNSRESFKRGRCSLLYTKNAVTHLNSISLVRDHAIIIVSESAHFRFSPENVVIRLRFCEGLGVKVCLEDLGE